LVVLSKGELDIKHKIRDTVFAGENSNYFVPYHTMINGISTAAQLLKTAQIAYDNILEKCGDDETKKNLVKVGLDLFSSIGYPRAGQSESDGNVVGLLRKDNILTVVSELRMFDNLPGFIPNIFIIEDFVMNYESIEANMLCSLVDSARVKYRLNYVLPVVKNIVILQ